MGKQINYFMDYETFRMIAKKALDLGAVIVPGGWSRDLGYCDISCITPNETRYLFFFPEYGNGSRLSSDRFSDCGNATIEAGFSRIQDRTIYRDRMYITSGYYDAYENWVPRPKEMDRIYNTLVRCAKKQLLYKVCAGRGWKDYITPAFDELVAHQNHVLSDF